MQRDAVAEVSYQNFDGLINSNICRRESSFLLCRTLRLVFDLGVVRQRCQNEQSSDWRMNFGSPFAIGSIKSSFGKYLLPLYFTKWINSWHFFLLDICWPNICFYWEPLDGVKYWRRLPSSPSPSFFSRNSFVRDRIMIEHSAHATRIWSSVTWWSVVESVVSACRSGRGGGVVWSVAVSEWVDMRRWHSVVGCFFVVVAVAVAWLWSSRVIRSVGANITNWLVGNSKGNNWTTIIGTTTTTSLSSEAIVTNILDVAIDGYSQKQRR